MKGRAPWTERLKLIVDERGEMPYLYVLAEMAALVPPGRAFRESERARQWFRGKRDSKIVMYNGSDERIIDKRVKVGSWRIARASIWVANKYGRVAIYDEDGVRMVKKGHNAWP